MGFFSSACDQCTEGFILSQSPYVLWLGPRPSLALEIGMPQLPWRICRCPPLLAEEPLGPEEVLLTPCRLGAKPLTLPSLQNFLVFLRF